jgi:WD40 repeat protein
MSVLNIFFPSLLAIILLSSEYIAFPERSLPISYNHQSALEGTTELIKIDTPLDIRIQGKIEKDFPLSWRSLYEKNNPLKTQLALQAYAQINKEASPNKIITPIFNALYDAVKLTLGDEFNHFLGHENVGISYLKRGDNGYFSLGNDGKLFFWEESGTSFMPQEIENRFIYFWRGEKMKIIPSSIPNYHIIDLATENQKTILYTGEGRFIQIDSKTDQYIEIINNELDLRRVKIFPSKEGWDIFSKNEWFQLTVHSPDKIVWNKQLLDFNVGEIIKSKAGYFILDTDSLYELNSDTGESAEQLMAFKGMPNKIVMDKLSETLAVGYISGDISLFDLSNQNERAFLSGHNARISALSFDNDQHLFSASFDKTVGIWDLNNLDAGPVKLSDQSSFITHLAIDEKAQRIVIGEINGTIKYYDLNLEKLKHLLCQSSIEPLSREAWSKYVGDERPYLPYHCEIDALPQD